MNRVCRDLQQILAERGPRQITLCELEALGFVSRRRQVGFENRTGDERTGSQRRESECQPRSDKHDQPETPGEKVAKS